MLGPNYASLIGTNPHMVALPISGAAPLANRGNPFSSFNPVFLMSPVAATIYGVNKAPESVLQFNNQGSYGLGTTGKPRYLRIVADGVLAAWSSNNYPALINLHNDGGALTDATRMINVLVVNGVPTPRKSSVTALTGADWRTVVGADSQLQAQKSGGGAYAAGTILEFFMMTAADIVTQGPTVANTPQEGKSYDFMFASLATAMWADRI